MKKQGALAQFVRQIKDERKAEASPSATLQKIVDDYCLSGQFDAYLARNARRMGEYVDDHTVKRQGRFRASAAGKCQQYQAFTVLARELTDKGAPLLVKVDPQRPARHLRALYNGTFAHIRWHMLFDALNDAGLVTTYAKEERRFSTRLNMDGTIDRLIGFTYNDREFRAILDFKSIKERYFKNLRQPQADHRMQHHAYKELDYMSSVDGWMMLYEDKNDHSLKIYDVPYDELTTKKLRRSYVQMAQWIEEFKAGTPVEARIKLPLTVTWCRYCEWQAVCLLEHPNLKEIQQKRIGEEDEDGELESV